MQDHGFLPPTSAQDDSSVFLFQIDPSTLNVSTALAC